MVLNKLFVYGTLIDTDLLKNRWKLTIQKIEPGKVQGNLYQAGWFPILKEDGKDTISGKVLTIENLQENLHKLDQYEGCDNSDSMAMYHRKVMEILLENGVQVKAWVYIGNTNSKCVRDVCIEENRIKNGIWEKRNDL